jgi:hypothetical protein
MPQHKQTPDTKEVYRFVSVNSCAFALVTGQLQAFFGFVVFNHSELQ